MIRHRLSKQEKIHRAMMRIEEAMAELLHAAEKLTSEPWQRIRLLGAARKYASSLNALTRIRK